MDLVSKTAAQIADIFQSMTPGARLTTGLLLVAIVVSIGFLFRYQTTTAEEFLLGGQILTQREIAAMEVAFATENLNGSEVVGNRIRVPRGQRHLYLAAAGQHGALPDSDSSANDSMFNSSNPFESKFMQELKARVAKEKDLAYTLRKMRGIENAKVTLEDETKDGFPPRKERRVMVAVETIGRKSLDEEQVRAVRETVASGAGVKASRVTVTDLSSNRAYPGREENGLPSADENIYDSTKRMFERSWQYKIQEQLSAIPNVLVGVNVELDPDINNQVTTVKYDEKPTSLETKTFTKESNSSGGNSGGRPGAVPNGVVGNTPQSVSGDGGKESSANENREEQKYVAGRTHSNIQKAPLVPKRVTVSLSIPKSYYETLWKQENPIPAGQEPKKPDVAELKTLEDRENKNLQQVVNNLIPRTNPGEDPYPRVVVTSYADMPSAPLVGPTTADHAIGWFSANWSTLAMLGVGLFSLLVLRNALKSTPPTVSSSEAAAAAATTAAAHPQIEALDTPDDADDPAEARRLRFQTSGRSLREELSEMIKEDPEGAANVLRNWIGEAA